MEIDFNFHLAFHQIILSPFYYRNKTDISQEALYKRGKKTKHEKGLLLLIHSFIYSFTSLMGIINENVKKYVKTDHAFIWPWHWRVTILSYWMCDKDQSATICMELNRDLTEKNCYILLFLFNYLITVIFFLP